MRSMVDESHEFLKPALHAKAICVDATLGRGKDTAFFLEQGVHKVIAFEVQADVLRLTCEKLQDPRLEAHLLGHESMDQIFCGEVDAMIFNFGYCPQGDPSICTHKDSSLLAVKKGLHLLKKKGRMALVLYPHPQGRQEAQVIEDFVQTLSPSSYTVVQYKQLNKDSSPYLIGIEKKEGTHA